VYGAVTEQSVSGKDLTPADAVLIANDLVQVRCIPTGTSCEAYPRLPSFRTLNRAETAQSDGCESIDASDNALGPRGAALLVTALLPDAATGACNRRHAHNNACRHLRRLIQGEVESEVAALLTCGARGWCLAIAAWRR
jgi:hypothetical protein